VLVLFQDEGASHIVRSNDKELKTGKEVTTGNILDTLQYLN